VAAVVARGDHAVTDKLVCPYCGRDFSMHSGQVCPVLGDGLTRMLREAIAYIEDERSARASALSLSQAVTPRVVRLGNGAGNAQLLCSFNLNRGVAIVYNDDAADVWLGADKQHIEDATMRYPLKTKTAIVFTSPAELWGFGSAAGPQLVSVLELPPGRAPVEFATLAKLA